LETFSHLLGKLLAPAMGSADSALGLRAVLESSFTSPWCSFPDFC